MKCVAAIIILYAVTDIIGILVPFYGTTNPMDFVFPAVFWQEEQQEPKLGSRRRRHAGDDVGTHGGGEAIQTEPHHETIISINSNRSIIPMAASSMFDRAYGCLLGQAIGDALGARYEFMTAEQTKSAIAQDSKNHSLLPLLGGGPFGMEPGQVTDDTEMAMALARSVQRRKKFDITDVARSYADWFYSNPPDIGITTANAFKALPQTSQEITTWSNDAIYRSVIESSKRRNSNSLSNGCLMRISPLAIVGSHWPLDVLRAAAISDCELTHPNPIAHDAVSTYVTAVWFLINTGDRRKAYEETLLRVQTSQIRQLLIDDNPSVPIVTIASDGSESVQMINGDTSKMGYLGVALKWAFMELRGARSFQDALINVISRGGDTDTNGCITAALIGAAVGASNIPEDWKSVVSSGGTRRITEANWVRMDDAERLVKDLLKATPPTDDIQRLEHVKRQRVHK